MGGMAGNTVFIVSEHPVIRDSLSKLVASAGLPAAALPSLGAWLDASGPVPRGCLLLYACVGELAEPERPARLASACARIPVLVLTDRGDVPTAVQAIKRGAAYVLENPREQNSLLEYIKRAVASQRGGARPADPGIRT